MVNKEKIFCENCERRIRTGNLINKGEPIHEFKDGYYCEKCGKAKVEEARKFGKQGKSKE